MLLDFSCMLEAVCLRYHLKSGASGPIAVAVQLFLTRWWAELHQLLTL